MSMDTETPENPHVQVQIRALRDLARTLPKNDMGLPTGIYRTDMLPFHDYVPPVGESPLSGLLAPPSSNVVPFVNTDPTPAVTEFDDVEDYDYAEEEEASLESEPEPSLQGPEGPDITEPDASQVVGSVESPMVPHVHRTAGFPSRELEKAFVWLNYDEGFPTLPGGVPFWGRLDFEPTDAYEAFQAYLRMNAGSPMTPDQDADEYTGSAASGTRALNELPLFLVRGQMTSGELLELQARLEEYYHLYYWSLRAQAYDLFKVAQYQRQLELRAIETQDEHYLLARKMKARLLEYMNGEEEFWDMMTPKVGIDFFKQLTQLERVSAGLPAMGPLSEKQAGEAKGSSFEVAFRRVAQAQNNVGTEDRGNDEDTLRMALEDPESTRVLQELIIKVGK